MSTTPSRRVRRALRARALGGGFAVLLLATGCAVDGTPSTRGPREPSPTTAPVRAARPSTPSMPSTPSTPSTPPGTGSPAPALPRPTPAPGRDTSVAVLAALIVRGRAPMTGYAREQFGPAWLDADRNGCDTRNDILRRDVGAATIKADTHGCVVLTGTLADPYTAQRIAFRRGAGDRVDIDHVVSLGNAWATGAWRWDVRRRAALANDPLNLLAVDDHTNRQKGDGDTATWLPPARSYRCAYVARQIAVKAKYRLSVTPAERAAMARVLASCPGQPATPDPTHAPTSVDQNIRTPGPSAPAVRPSSGAGDDTNARGLVAGRGPVRYRNCDAVRAAGAAPIRRGQPGYSRALDRDGDGVGCE